MTHLLSRLLVATLVVAPLTAVVVDVVAESSGSAAAPAAAPPVTPQVDVTGLTVNGRTNPLGIPGAAPRFGWQGESPAARGVVQTAYRIRVMRSLAAGAPASVVWDSGKQASDAQVDVPYAGPALLPATRYTWQVQTWDGQDVASDWSPTHRFETGLFGPYVWGNSTWIGAPPATLEWDRWQNYTADFTFSIKQNGFAAYFASERTGARPTGWVWQISVADGKPRLIKRRATGTTGEPAMLEHPVDLSSFISADQLKQGRHVLRISLGRTLVTTWLDGKPVDSTDLSIFLSSPQGLSKLQGYVGLRTGMTVAGAEHAVVYAVSVTGLDGKTLLDTDFSGNNPFAVGTRIPDGIELRGEAEGIWTSPDQTEATALGVVRKPGVGLPLLRTEFAASDKSIVRARIYATARGLYEMSLNGTRVGDQFVAPGFTEYAKRFQHQTYDVTALVRNGANAWGAELTPGWYAGQVAWQESPAYGTNISLLARLRIDYSDGTTQWVSSDSAKWKTHAGPLMAADLFDGESYDARLAQPGYDRVGFDDSSWSPTVVAATGTSTVVPQPDEPVRETQEIIARSSTNPAPGKYVYDLGQEITGVVRVELTGKAGSTVTIRHAEWLKDGNLFTGNLRTADQTDTYTFDSDGRATYEPTFTMHGFRYVEISGTDTPPTPVEVTGIARGSDLPATGSLTTSNATLNKLLSNISWGQRTNFVSIPTDTPARDERLGALGDFNGFLPTANYLRDTRAFVGKWLADLRDEQLPNGDFPGGAPLPPGLQGDGGCGWSDVAVNAPYQLWRSYRDASAIRDNWESMVRFFEFVRQGAGADLIDDPARSAWGDWLNLEAKGGWNGRADLTPKDVICTAYYADDAKAMSEMATAIGSPGQAAEYADLATRIRTAFASRFISPDGAVHGGYQTCYALALGMGLVPDSLKKKVGEKFAEHVQTDGNHLMTGFVGTPLLLPALSAVGRDDVAWKLLMRTEYPSWLYEVKMGATTTWERWDTVRPDGSIWSDAVDTMNSFNHYTTGSVGDWIYQKVGGIAPAAPGYKVALIAPRPGGDVDHAVGSLRSVYGRIRSEWTVQRSGLFITGMDLTVDVPVNTTAQVVLPGQTPAWVREGGKVLSAVEGVQSVSTDGGWVTVTVGSGHYRFVSNADNQKLGEPLGEVVDLRRDVGTLAAQGVSAEDRADMDGSLGRAQLQLEAAVAAQSPGGLGSAAPPLGAAVRELTDLRTWLTNPTVGGSIPPATRDDLERRVQDVLVMVSLRLAEATGVSVTLVPPEPARTVPGATVNTTVSVVNTSSRALSGVGGVVHVDGWGDFPFGGTATVPPGGRASLAVALRLPADVDPGQPDAELRLAYTSDRAYNQVVVQHPALQVTSALEIGNPTLSSAFADIGRQVYVHVPVTNAAPVPTTVRAQVATAQLPRGWVSAPSDAVQVPALGSATLRVPLVPMERINGESVTTTVTVTRPTTGSTLAAKTYSFVLAGPTSSPSSAIDHLDWGDSASETGHQVDDDHTGRGGTSVEAGYTRRYANDQFAGGFFTGVLKVPAGKPFVIRCRETFGGAALKHYAIRIDGVLVKEMKHVRTWAAPGIGYYDVLVDDPRAVAETSEGLARIEFRFLSGDGASDPSIADTWVMPVPANPLGPSPLA